MAKKGLVFVQKWPNMRKNMRKNVKYANMRIKALYAQKTYLLDFDIPRLIRLNEITPKPKPSSVCKPLEC